MYVPIRPWVRSEDEDEEESNDIAGWETNLDA